MKWLPALMKYMDRGLGFEYVKLDGANMQAMVAAGVPSNPKMAKGQIMRQALEAFRSGLGPDVYLLNAGLFGLSIGLVNAMRIGNDVGARWDASLIDRHRGERDRYPGSGLVHRCIAVSCWGWWSGGTCRR